MTLNKNLKILLAVGLQVFIILSVVVFKYFIITDGVEVILKVQPTDPRDPLRGDYITFTYNISRLPSYLAKGESLKIGDVVYVSLREGKTYWTAYKISKQKPDFKDSIFIKGKVESVSEDLSIIYGIEEYFIPENSGENFSFINKFITAKIFIDKNGNAVFKQIYINNKPWP